MLETKRSTAGSTRAQRLPRRGDAQGVARVQQLHSVDHSCGGCHSRAIQITRDSTTYSLFNRKAMTVARPVGHSPTMCVPPFAQAKCSRQVCKRGLDSGTIAPVAGSSAWVREPLNSLHR